PADLMMTSDLQVKILDLGIRQAFPLQMVGERPDQRSDVFSLGAVFYELLTGHRSASGYLAPELVATATLTPPPPITDFREDASPALNEVVMNALAIDPKARYQTVGDLARDLRDLSLAEFSRDQKRAARANDPRGGGKSGAAEGEDLPPGS